MARETPNHSQRETACLCVCVCTGLRGAVCGRGTLLVSGGTLEHLHIGLELVEKTASPALPRLGGLAVMHPAGTTFTWTVVKVES